MKFAEYLSRGDISLAMASRIGVDIGSLFLKVAYLDANSALIGAQYKPHGGEPEAYLQRIIAHYPTRSISITGSSLDFNIARVFPQHDLVNATIQGVLHLRPDVRNIIDLGASSATLIELDSRGRFRSLSQNTLCAAGTGSFIDEELARLGISYADLAALPVVNKPPVIASRCAVFAKTDMIHRQQEGHSKNEVLEGLCRSMLRTCLDVLLKSKTLYGPTALVGGIVENPKIVRWLNHDYPVGIVAIALGPIVSALGAGLIMGESAKATVFSVNTKSVLPQRPLLKMTRTHYPSWETYASHLEEGTEVRELVKLVPGRLQAYVGLDIGSTSTKAVVMDCEGRLLLDLYRKTQGDPVSATRKLFEILERIILAHGLMFEVLGIGTTGSGRKLIGELIGADLVVNEVSAHALGAAWHSPDITTVFEIGGQDAKYLRLWNGHVIDSNMNYVCAAGTGSFVEEQARKLSYKIEDIGDAVLGISPPITSDRCTIFMEQDIRKLLRQGATRAEVLAATIYSVIQNYLAKVVGNRPVDGERVMFVGATARNKGLVAAIEQLLGVEVVVPSYCHVMGAVGVCLELAEVSLKTREPSKFRGFAAMQEEVNLYDQDCNLCTNFCRITELQTPSLHEKVSWGYMCGREPSAVRQREIPGLALMRQRDRLLQSYKRPIKSGRPTIGIPMSLATYQFLPLWSAFFDQLGYNLVVSRPSSSMTRLRGDNLAAPDFCFPAKVSLGHVADLLDNAQVDHIFLPSLLENQQNDATSRSYLCPMIINMPYYSKAALVDHTNIKHILFAPFNFNWPETRQLNFLEQHLGGNLNVSRRQLQAAFHEGIAAQQQFTANCQEIGQNFLMTLDTTSRALVVLGRPYLLYDYEINLHLPQTIASYGHTILPVDLMPFNDITREELRENFNNMYWHNGQMILNAVEFVREHPQLNAIFLTSFNCGPDSFLVSYAENAMGHKPMITLELDIHSSAGGYITRLEAFFDNIAKNPIRKVSKYHAGIEIISLNNLSDEEEIVAQNNPDPLPSVYVSALRHAGYRAHVLPPASADTYALGMRYMKGTECCPAIASAGAILDEALKADNQPFNVFFARTCGPCRLGQYIYKFNTILKEHRQGVSRFVTFKLNIDQQDSFGVDLKLSVFRGLAALDVLGKLVQRTRPYERIAGNTDRVYEVYRSEILTAVEIGDPVDVIIARAAAEFTTIPVNRRKRPIVGIVGEFFVRADSFINQDLVRCIEANGGEAWLVDTTEWQIWGTSRSLPEYGEYGEGVTDTDGAIPPAKVLAELEAEQDRLITLCGDLLCDRHEPNMRDVYSAAEKYVDITCS